MALKLHHLLGFLVWLVLTYGVLALSTLPGDFGESLCGPWG
jgi:hypothetical protein